MSLTEPVKRILSNYESDSPGAKAGVFNEVRAIHDGGGNGSIIGRNTSQRPKAQAIDMLNRIIKIYLGKD